jgi:hypothetical protein
MSTIKDVSIATQWAYIASAALSTCWFAWHRLAGRCKWEPVAVSVLGGTVATVRLCFEGSVIVNFDVAQNGRAVPWLRYVGLLITLPVLMQPYGISSP